ncbi:hypothetical protein BY996DRAFT_4591823 [Phakopsora pachyrhizi]|nr:hypothetical protein BY996DRAFT_4591823 [Phakopsora pachyrhizi]
MSNNGNREVEEGDVKGSKGRIEEITTRLNGLGLAQKQISDTIRNRKLTDQLSDFLDRIFGSTDPDPIPSDKQRVTLLLRWSNLVINNSNTNNRSEKSCGDDGELSRRSNGYYVVDQIFNGNLNSSNQLEAALEYLNKIESDDKPIDEDDFKKSCGIGVSVSKDQVRQIVDSFVSSFQPALDSEWTALSKTIVELKRLDSLRWCNPIDLKESVDQSFLTRFGPKESINIHQASSKKKSIANQSTSKSNSNSKVSKSSSSIFEVGMLSQLHRPGQNPQKDPKLIEDHLRVTGGSVITRFPPEPNGFLHIGHSKAIAINFGFADFHKGKCYLRFDDTNPEAEEQVYLDSILEIVRWLGFEPDLITYSSDNFQRLYDLAEELIRRDKAYVCFCSGAEIKANRGGEERGPRKACAHRTLPVEESLKQFRRMKEGDYGPNEIVLRMKQDLEDGNPQMWDLVAYRVLKANHHRTGDRWKIYPTYDFTHCLCDSFENITQASPSICFYGSLKKTQILFLFVCFYYFFFRHSLCTTEFIQSRVSYEWLCHALDLYTPKQTEYGRLNLEGTVMSKRKIMKLVKENHVEGWDDPRLYTLIALRRRGVPPEAILKFVNSLGVSTSVSNIAIHRFEQSVRQHLEMTTPRLMMVLDPIRVRIENLPDDHLEIIERAIHPKVPEMGTVKVPFTNQIYIERQDFSPEESEDFFRLTPKKSVGLFQVPFPIRFKDMIVDPSSGRIEELICVYEDKIKLTKSNKPKAYIHWVAESKDLGSPIRLKETRIYKQLFRSTNPAGLEDFLKDVEPNSLEICEGSLIEVGLKELMIRMIKEEEQRKMKNQKELEERDLKARRAGLTVKAADDGVGDDSGRPEGGRGMIRLENVRFQGMRNGYFCIDHKLSDIKICKSLEGNFDGGIEFSNIFVNRIVSLKEDSGKKV